jgi:secondary thiamine-phosphate synthase enzyme
MNWLKETIKISTNGKGLYECTGLISEIVKKHSIKEGMCYLFLQHTSASLVISENADPTAKMDLETFINKIAAEDQSWHRHTLEGSDDSPSHMKSIITGVSEIIPIDNGKLSIGTWQGVYVFEHRNKSHLRNVLVRILKVE